MLARLYEQTRESPVGVVIIEGAILVEAKWTNLVNNNVILVDAPKEVRLQRLISRSDIDEQEALAKIDRQISKNERKTMLEQRINEFRWGRLWTINNDEQSLKIDHIVDEIVSLAQP